MHFISRCSHFTSLTSFAYKSVDEILTCNGLLLNSDILMFSSAYDIMSVQADPASEFMSQ